METMSEMQEQLIERARKTYKRIFPCASRRSFDECFTIFGRKFCFWFDTDDGSTHMVVTEVAQNDK
jgi:hypothetical protein